ncbi:MAG: hypothetical protein WC876_12440 [Candidatus Thermoplasmatota archaeon]|jgi:hypothetical protein
MRWVPFALIGVLFLAGCLTGNDPADSDDSLVAETVGAGWAARAVTNLGTDDQHDHSDPTQHEGFTTPNFEILGYDPLVTKYHGRPAGGTYCGAVAETEDRTIAVYHSFTTDVAIEIVDLSNVSDPELIGELVLPLTHVYDATVTDDGRFAVLATDPLDTGPDIPPQFDALATYSFRPLFRDACGNEFQGPETNLPYASGLVLVDLADPTNPTVVDYEAQPVLGAHSVSAATIDGTTYVAASTTNLAHGASYYVFYTVESLPAAGLPNLVPYGAWTAQYPSVEAVSAAALTNGHVDATIQKHPVTNQVIAYLANWNGGLVTLELAGLGNVSPLGVWDDYDANGGSEMTGQWHSVRPLEGLRNGRHITLFGQEIGGRPSERPTSLALLMDTTDPTHPVSLARWTLPIDVQWDGGAMWSTHYLDLVGDTLFVSLYHGGVWAADASEENWPNLPSVGAFVPNAAPPDQPIALYADWDPLVMEVNHLADGTLVIMDGTSGAYTVRFTEADPRVPAVAGWTEDDWTPT